VSAAVAAVTLSLLAGLVVAGPAGPEVGLRRLRPDPAVGQQLRLPVPGWTPPAVAVAAMVALLAGHGLPALALVAVAAAARGPGARRTRAEAQVRARLTRDLPRAADLLATCLEAGAEPASALGEVAAAIGGPLAARLRPVALALAAGSTAAAGAGSGGPDDPVERLVRTLVRAGETGAPLASSVRDLAADERERARWDALERARRAGVQAVGPLAACFLPAFVLVGVVPVVVGVARSLLAGWA
jgi:pilus assembly protein TadC